MTDPVTRAKAAIMRVLYSEAYQQSPSNFVQLFTEEVSQEIDQSVLVERNRCAAIVRSYWSADALMSLNEQQRIMEDMAQDIEQGVEHDRDTPPI